MGVGMRELYGEIRQQAPRASSSHLSSAASSTRPGDDIPLLAPLVQQEILIRLLTSPQGACLAQGARPEGHAGRIEALAARVHMSPSSLHHHFRAVTTMSPLQFQKQLRLQEARRLLMGGDVEVASAAYRVGYESPSQFTREYSRLFGVSPLRDLHRLGRRRGEG